MLIFRVPNKLSNALDNVPVPELEVLYTRFAVPVKFVANKLNLFTLQSGVQGRQLVDSIIELMSVLEA
jgi:hypothetical protein